MATKKKAKGKNNRKPRNETVSDTPSDAAFSMLVDLERAGNLTRKSVLELAEATPGSPLHQYVFAHDDATAARNYRQLRCGKLITAYHVEYKMRKVDLGYVVPAFVSGAVRKDRYDHISSVKKSAHRSRQQFTRELNMLVGTLKRVGNLQVVYGYGDSILGWVDEVKALLDSLEKPRSRRKTKV